MKTLFLISMVIFGIYMLVFCFGALEAAPPWAVVMFWIWFMTKDSGAKRRG
jgi:hypothetical protein